MNGQSMPLSSLLATAVLLEIMRLERFGGPDWRDREALAALGHLLSERGEALLHGGEPGEFASLFNQTVRAIAVLAFLPGGVTLFGSHWEAAP